MDSIEFYRAYSPAPLYVSLGYNLIKVYFNEVSAEVTLPVSPFTDTEDAVEKKVTEYVAWHVNVAPEYSAIIAGIIRSKYSQDDVEAILCNHAEGREEEEYTALIAWRKMARDVAQKVIASLVKTT